jgi:hypothetical protein
LRPPCERAIRVRPCDSIRIEATPALVPAKRARRASREPSVDGSAEEAVSAKPELEHGDVPADRSDAQLALPEEWATAPAQRASRGAPHTTGRPDAMGTLEGPERLGRHRPADAVDGPGVEPVGSEPDLDGGDASTGGQPAGREREDANGQRDADDGEPTHVVVFATDRGRPAEGVRGPRLQSRGCLPR